MPRLIFHGTRSSGEKTSHLHLRHSMLQVTDGETNLLLDMGSDWKNRLPVEDPSAILLTHGHDDHAGGITSTLSVPVYASAKTATLLADRPADLRILPPEKPMVFGAIKVLPLEVQHSHRAPMTGLRITAGTFSLVYLPDVADLPHPGALLAGTDLYIGDGSSFGDELWWVEAGVRCGHAPISEQLQWCAAAGVGRAIFTHCGPGVMADEQASGQRLADLGGKYGVAAEFAWDGMVVELE